MQQRKTWSHAATLALALSLVAPGAGHAQGPVGDAPRDQATPHVDRDEDPARAAGRTSYDDDRERARPSDDDDRGRARLGNDDDRNRARLGNDDDRGRAAPLVGYDDDLFLRSRAGRHELHLGSRLQARFQMDVQDGPDDGYLTIPRARLSLKGQLFDDTLSFKVQGDFSKGAPSLEDLYVDYEAVPGWLYVRAGKTKRPFSRQQVTSSGRLELVDRAITDDAFGAGRDLGLMLHATPPSGMGLEYAVGLFDDTGDPTASPTATERSWHPALVARIGASHGELEGYREADLQGGPLRLGVAGGAVVGMYQGAGVRFGVDYALKAHGLSSTGGVYLSSTGADLRPQAAGFHLQAGWMVLERVQPVVRYARVDRWAQGGEQELLGGLSLYFDEHAVKWQIDAGRVTLAEPVEPRTDLRIRSQLQFGF